MPATPQEESEDCLTEARLRGQSSHGLASWQQRRMHVSVEENRCGTTCSFALRPSYNKRSVWRPRQELPGLALRRAVAAPVFHRPRREQSETEFERLLVHSSWNLLLTAKQVQITYGTQPRNCQPKTDSIKVHAGNCCSISSLTALGGFGRQVHQPRPSFPRLCFSPSMRLAVHQIRCRLRAFANAPLPTTESRRFCIRGTHL